MILMVMCIININVCVLLLMKENIIIINQY